MVWVNSWYRPCSKWILDNIGHGLTHIKSSYLAHKSLPLLDSKNYEDCPSPRYLPTSNCVLPASCINASWWVRSLGSICWLKKFCTTWHTSLLPPGKLTSLLIFLSLSLFIIFTSSNVSTSSLQPGQLFDTTLEIDNHATFQPSSIARKNLASMSSRMDTGEIAT